MKSICKCNVDELAYAFEIIPIISTAALQSNTLILKLNIHKKKMHLKKIVIYCLPHATETLKKIKQNPNPFKTGSLWVKHQSLTSESVEQLFPTSLLQWSYLFLRRKNGGMYVISL